MINSNSQIFVLERGRTLGPFRFEDVRRMRLNGQCSSQTQITNNPQDQSSWYPLDRFIHETDQALSVPSPLAPPPLTDGHLVGATDNRTASIGLMRPFPVAVLILLHFLTAGLFTFFRTTGTHGVLPKFRTDAPNAFMAIGLLFVPFYNLYWLFVVYPRLAQRVDTFGKQFGLPRIVPPHLAWTVSTFAFIPVVMGTIGVIVLLLTVFSDAPKTAAIWIFMIAPHFFSLMNFFVVFPIFSGLVQRNINLIFDAQIGLLKSGKPI